jgi:hypothetical protein
MKEVDQLRASRGFTGPHKFVISSKRINGAGLTGIGTSSKSDFSAVIGRTLLEARCTDQKLCRLEVDLGH